MFCLSVCLSVYLNLLFLTGMVLTANVQLAVEVFN